MSQRTQKNGAQKKWTLEQLRVGLESFYGERGRYPTATEIDTYAYLPSSRSIQRQFGGLIELRKMLTLKTQNDLRTGAHSRDRAFTINQRAHITEHKVYEFLCQCFGKEFVHREYFFIDDRRTRADFFIYDHEKGFCVDVFYPRDRKNLIGCLNNKLHKYQILYMQQYPVIFLQMNLEIDQTILDEVVEKKVHKLSIGQYLMSWTTFETFCASREPLHAN